MNYKQGIPRDQLVLYSDCLDNIIPEDSHARVIDAYVENLDITQLGFIIPKLKTGAPPYRPQLLIKIYVYGYLEKIRSSRKLENECKRNIEMIWLTCKLAPDFKTIADFRKNNGPGLKRLFKDFLIFCNEMNLLTLKLIAVDGSKMRAQNSQNNVYTRNKIDQVQQSIEQKIEEYLRELEIEDEKELEKLEMENKEVKAVVKRLLNLKKHKKKVEKIKQEFETDKTKEKIFATDRDSRFQSDQGKVRPGYNVQTASDDENKILIANDVTNESNDLKQMTPMLEKVEKVKKELEIDTETDALHDNGYFSEKEILNNLDNDNLKIYVAGAKAKKKDDKKENKKLPLKGFELQDFKYDKENDEFICPEGKKLYKMSKKPTIRKTDGTESIRYRCKHCDNCPSRNKCTGNKQGRTLTVSVNREKIEAYKELMSQPANKKLLSKRKEIIEHPFGTIKRTLGYDYFMQKGLEKVKAEFSFICFIYNFKRVLNIFSVKELIEAIKKRAAVNFTKLNWLAV